MTHFAGSWDFAPLHNCTLSNVESLFGVALKHSAAANVEPALKSEIRQTVRRSYTCVHHKRVLKASKMVMYQ